MNCDEVKAKVGALLNAVDNLYFRKTYVGYAVTKSSLDDVLSEAEALRKALPPERRFLMEMEFPNGTKEFFSGHGHRPATLDQIRNREGNGTEYVIALHPWLDGSFGAPIRGAELKELLSS